MTNMELGNPGRPKARSLENIFDDLRVLAQSPGTLHDISAIMYRDWIVAIALREAKVADDPEKRWSTTKLNSNEFMLLLGLMVQSASDCTYSIVNTDIDFADKADRLLREFHDRLTLDSMPDFSDPGKIERALGAAAREAIYYGADSFFLHQLERFARDRYRDDFEWLIRNAGLSARPMVEIARFIMEHTSRQMSAINARKEDGTVPTKADLTDSLLIAKAELIKKFGASKAKAFMAKFATPVTNANANFTSAFVVNQANLAPLIDIGEHLYAPNAYRLAESVYESPTYWMIADKTYVDIAAKHRGAFLEKAAADLFRSVFGAANVYENVTIQPSKKKTAGEADALIVYGEFVIVVQAKSKRVTLTARAGDEEALNKDFEGAIQAPYRQAYEFAELVQAGAECKTKDGKALTFPPTVRVFPAVILSDAFPAATFLSNIMLKRSDRIAPVIWDLGVLDCVARMLPTPIEFLYYLKCRSDVFDKMHSDSEYNFLGYHLKYKLAMDPEYDFMHLEKDFAEIVEDFMMPRDVGVKTVRPVSILERLDIPVISELFKSLKTAPPELASVVIDLYDFSYGSLTDLSKTVLAIREEVAAGKEMKSFSILTETGGLTYLVCRTLNDKIWLAAEAIGQKHKYDSKRDRWYVIVDDISTSAPVDAALPLVEKWHEDADLAENSRKVDELFKTKWQPRAILPRHQKNGPKLT
ncbi:MULTISPECIES: nuclease-related domain-containing protein [unclassified Mesorhizobium]|uniref:nuclease-related domain-containing protein n=1 Tax=unclassified Mesorhizobium TaxID=325217 RepID=UPI001CCC76BC|nr:MULTISPECIES: nuclease-related domain-containing protein [unclassified Mesorhizobium]MBZ9815965.1 NERD domain-containing protein [Mesorhizobium sp. CA7]MBZ9846306.1 NERD domain-containing protein [Mesorhizobium sp. CA5]MBZ9863692.1 NERD domain-containing protein [Mesorhizobium sp. CA12]